MKSFLKLTILSLVYATFGSVVAFGIKKVEEGFSREMALIITLLLTPLLVFIILFFVDKLIEMLSEGED